MGYYCTVPQCTSLAGKTKNVKFHRFPRDECMAAKWNLILKRGKPYTKYSKVCSLHFTQADYNVTTMGHWKTLSKDAIPSQNLPKLNPDGTVMVIRKSRTVKYREGKREDGDKSSDNKWCLGVASHSGLPPADAGCSAVDTQDNAALAYRLQTLGAIANNLSPHQQIHQKPKKQDAFMQTDPVQNEDDDTQPNNSYSEVSDKSYNSEVDPYAYTKEDYPTKDSYPKESYLKDYQKDLSPYNKDSDYQKDTTYPKDYAKDATYAKDANYAKDAAYAKDYAKEGSSYAKDKYEPKDYTKTSEDYIPQTNEEYNKEAEKYALERKSHNGYDHTIKDLYQKDIYQKDMYQKNVENNIYYDKNYRSDYLYQNYTDSAEMLRNQQHNLQILQEQHRLSENQNFFNENHIKQEIDINVDDYERSKEMEATGIYERRLTQRIMDHIPTQVKQEPEPNGHDVVMQPQGSPYYQPTAHNNISGNYYEPLSRPGPELLIAKQNALAAHSQLWQNTMKRPFFYSETPHYNGPQILHRYEDLSRILQ